jgi:hypothetical protein
MKEHGLETECRQHLIFIMYNEWTIHFYVYIAILNILPEVRIC